MPGIHTMAAPPAGSSARIVASTPNTTGEGKSRDRETDADHDALQDRGESDAVEHTARDARKVIEQLLAMLLRHRDQSLQRGRTSTRRRAA